MQEFVMFGCKRKGGREREGEQEKTHTRGNTHKQKEKRQTHKELFKFNTTVVSLKAKKQGKARETHEPELALWSCSVARSSKLVAASHSLLKSC